MKDNKPLFEEDAIERINSPFFISIYPNGRTLENYRKETETKLSYTDTVNRIAEFIAKNNISHTEAEIFQKILEDEEIINKLVFIWDGSYRTQRIFYKKFSSACNNNFSVDSDWLYKNNQDDYYNMTTSEKIDFLKNNYEIIFIHLVDDESSLRDMLFDNYYDDMPDYDDQFEE